MTLAAFQRAFADLAASPTLCLAVRDRPDTALAGYDLNKRERDRLVKAVWQKGMDANCTLYRATRIAALNSIAPLTLGALKPVLRDLLDAYWAEHPVHDVRFLEETTRFIDWLDRHRARLPEPADAIIALARRELTADKARLTSPMLAG
ncbi:hypothetical protein [Sphingomonas jaspsi]|uniref:hypothetical protein n=1 Tax=Sphingomonas jaspsi TaxID=392409 RepID=UPI0004B47FFE|nr:hypothetical protein [Sphingomonas jaspsi]